jgi:hypothetical protein
VASCGAITASGGRCSATVRPGAEWCYNHDPARAQERRRNASRAARSRPSRELATIKGRLEELTEQVLAGSVDRGRAAVANQLINTRLRAIELERKVRETEEFETRLETLEDALEQNRGGNRWGA